MMCSTGLIAGLDDLKGPFQPKRVYDPSPLLPRGSPAWQRKKAGADPPWQQLASRA